MIELTAHQANMIIVTVVLVAFLAYGVVTRGKKVGG